MTFKISFSAIGASCSNESNSTANTRSINLHPSSSRILYGRSFTIWLHLYSAIFYTEFNLVITTYLLHVWVFVLGVFNSCNYLLRNNNFAVLLSSVRRRLPLVVEIFLDIGIHCRILICILLSLLRYKATNRGHCINIFIFRLHNYNGLFIFFANRFNWIFFLFLVHP